MASDSDGSSNGSSSLDDHKNRRSHKNKGKSERERKKYKKDKKRHKEKRRRRNSSSSDTEPVEKINKTVIRTPEVEVSETFGPALPPALLQNRDEKTEQKIIGPTMPSNLPAFQQDKIQTTTNELNEDINDDDDDDDDAGMYGPVPAPNGEYTQMTATQIELEQRALEMKLAGIEGNSGAEAVDQKVREEWMLELPEVGLKGGLAALSNMKRTFHQGKEKPDFADRSVWTKTPQDAAKPEKPTTSAKSLEDEARAAYDRRRDEEQERIARKHKKKHKREESLVEMHQKKLRKEQRRKEKELAASGAKPERRPFSRDIDLKMNKIDSNQTKQIVDKAKILNTKFSTGHTKYL